LQCRKYRLASLKFGSQADVAALDPRMCQKFGPCIVHALRGRDEGLGYWHSIAAGVMSWLNLSKSDPIRLILLLFFFWWGVGGIVGMKTMQGFI